MALFVSRWAYYLRSIPTLLRDIRPRRAVLAVFLGRPAPRPFIITLRDGCRFKVRSAMDIWIIKEACLDRDYERHAVSIEDGWTVIDIGGALGDFAICTARAHPGARVYVYEPFPESFALLQENLALNGVSNVEAFRCAVGARAETLLLDTASGVAVRHSTAAAGGAVAVESIALDGVFEALGLAACDFLKIDCEGGEYDILFHASDATLRKIRHISMEYHDGVTGFSHADLVRFLREKGFHVATAPNPAHAEIGFLYAASEDERE
ncbi:MAG: FkbM family methyltransferase [Anaerolineae bacterium]|nr:FkbM family methyltransferase [Anaerolineae bacterium]